METSNIDMHQHNEIWLTIVGTATALGAWFHENIAVYMLQVTGDKIWPILDHASKILGFCVALVVIWMNIETAINRRIERKKLRNKKS